MNKKIFRGLMLAVSVCALSFVALGQQQQSSRARRGGGGGGLDNLSLPSTTARVAAAATGAGMWQMFAPEGAGFSVLVPGIPEEATRVGREQGTLNALFRGYRLAAGNLKYELTRTPPLPEPVTTHPEYPEKFFVGITQGLTAALQAANAQIKFRLVSQGAISLNGSEGRELEFAAPTGHRAVARIFIIDNCVYALTVLGPKSEMTPDTVNRFLDSFALAQ